jgi:hypothetical protein
VGDCFDVGEWDSTLFGERGKGDATDCSAREVISPYSLHRSLNAYSGLGLS